MQFEWDERKRIANIRKHFLDFEEVVDVLSGDTLDLPSRHVGEERWLSVGEWNDRVIVVVWTARGSVRRIISARYARENERGAYRQAVAERSS